jgi:hypothetical protein
MNHRADMKTTATNDPVIQVYMRDIDRSLLRENLKLTHAERLEKLVRFSAFADELRRAGEKTRAKARRPRTQ